MSIPRIAAVTGANKGIGLAIVRSLALRYATSPLATAASSSPFLIYLTSRDRERGENAVKTLAEDAALRDAKVFRKDGGLVDIRYKQLDVSEDGSISDFVGFLNDEHKEGIDILHNNAGVALDGFDTSAVDTTLQTNYHAPLSLSLRLLPLLRLSATTTHSPRIVNTSSLLSKLSTPKYSPHMIAAFRAAISSRSIASVTDLMDAFAEAVAYEAAHPGDESAKVGEEGWPRSAYAVSKAGLTAISMILGREELRLAARPKRRGGKEEEPKLPVLINACCPGFVNTDMTNNRGKKTPERGAETPVMLALDDLKGVGGKFWERKSVSVWDAADDVRM